MTGWPEPLIEDYLNLFENMVLIAGSVDNKMELVPGAEEGNIPIFDGSGQIEDSGESIDTIRARSYFYGRIY